MTITVHGNTDEERKLYVRGYTAAIMDAVKVLADTAIAAGEKVGEAPVGSFTHAKNTVNGLCPRGTIVATYTVE